MAAVVMAAVPQKGLAQQACQGLTPNPEGLGCPRDFTGLVLFHNENKRFRCERGRVVEDLSLPTSYIGSVLDCLQRRMRALSQTPTVVAVSKGLLPGGAACRRDGECASNDCEGGRCAADPDGNIARTIRFDSGHFNYNRAAAEEAARRTVEAARRAGNSRLNCVVRSLTQYEAGGRSYEIYTVTCGLGEASGFIGNAFPPEGYVDFLYGDAGRLLWDSREAQYVLTPRSGQDRRNQRTMELTRLWSSPETWARLGYDVRVVVSGINDPGLPGADGIPGFYRLFDGGAHTGNILLRVHGSAGPWVNAHMHALNSLPINVRLPGQPENWTNHGLVHCSNGACYFEICPPGAGQGSRDCRWLKAPDDPEAFLASLPSGLRGTIENVTVDAAKYNECRECRARSPGSSRCAEPCDYFVLAGRPPGARPCIQTHEGLVAEMRTMTRQALAERDRVQKTDCLQKLDDYARGRPDRLPDSFAPGSFFAYGLGLGTRRSAPSGDSFFQAGKRWYRFDKERGLWVHDAAGPPVAGGGPAAGPGPGPGQPPDITRAPDACGSNDSGCAPVEPGACDEAKPAFIYYSDPGNKKCVTEEYYCSLKDESRSDINRHCRRKRGETAWTCQNNIARACPERGCEYCRAAKEPVEDKNPCAGFKPGIRRYPKRGERLCVTEIYSCRTTDNGPYSNGVDGCGAVRCTGHGCQRNECAACSNEDCGDCAVSGTVSEEEQM